MNTKVYENIKERRILNLIDVSKTFRSQDKRNTFCR